MREKVNVAHAAPSNRVFLCIARRGITTARARRALQCYRFKGAEETRMFDLECGTDEVRKEFLAGRSSSAIWQKWNRAAAGFAEARSPYLLY